jgi:cytochrome c
MHLSIRFWPFIISLMAAMPAAHPVGAQDRKILETGKAALTKNCSACHAVGKTGTSPHLQAPPFRTLSSRYQIENLAEALAEGISVGHPDMPEFKFDPDEIGAILEYLKSVQER